MEATVIITALALLQFTWFGFQVGAMRGKHGVKAPATSGHEEFDRMFRVHMNTLEQLAVFIPALWMHAWLANPMWGAAIGGVFIIGRFLYRAEYFRDPASRSLGFGLTLIPSTVLLLWALAAAVMRLL